MKVTLVTVMTVNGFIADESGDYSWASKEDWEHFQDLYKETGCIIIGHNTYEQLKDKPSFPTPGRLCIVLTHDTKTKSAKSNLIFLNSTPKQSLEYLKNKGYRHVLVGGGGKLNSSFIKEGLVDDIYVTIEPVVLGRGTPLIATGDIEATLELIEVKKLNQNTIRLHYQLLKLID